MFYLINLNEQFQKLHSLCLYCSGHQRVCEKHDIGTQCGDTAINTATKTFENIDATNIQQNQHIQQNSQKPIRQLEVVPNPAEVCQNDPDGYQAAGFVPSKVPRWRNPPYLNILIPEHHITPDMIKVNVMAKLNTVPDAALREIEEYLDIWTFKRKTEEKWKLTLEEFFDILNIKSEKVIFLL